MAPAVIRPFHPRAPIWKRYIPIANQGVLPRTGYSCSTTGPKIYFFGGKAGGQVFGDTWEFDLAAESLKKLSCTGDLPTPRSEHSTVIIDGFMYLCGGLDGDGKEITGLSALKISELRWYHPLAAPPLKPCGVKPVMVAVGTKHVYIYRRNIDAGDGASYIIEIGRVLDADNHQPLHFPMLSQDDSSLVDIEDPDRPKASGGYGEVLKARHRPTNMIFAVKRPRGLSAHDASDVLRRFRREAGTAASIKHRHILKICGPVEVRGHTYIVSPWMEMGDLHSYLQDYINYHEQMVQLDADHPIHWRYANFDQAVITREIADAIAFMHTCGIIHGDVKAANILLSDGGHTLLCDFGLAKSFEHITSKEVKGVGSMQWTSKELSEGGSKTPQSDVYAFGMTIVEVLTGSPPFPGLSAVKFLLDVVIGDLRPAFSPQSRLGLDFMPLWEIASRCWDPLPTKRPSMAEVIHYLDQAYGLNLVR